MVRQLAAVSALTACIMGDSALAQPVGPPIAPEQQFQAQPVPRTQLPPVYVPPVGGGGPTYSTPLIPAPAQGTSRGRAAECQHQAMIDRVPRSERGAYVHNCMMN